MIPLNRDSALTYWYAALEEEIGVAFPVSDKKNARQILYDARKQSGDPRLEKLMMFDVREELWIVKKDTELP